MFLTTQWSEVVRAGRNDTTRARAALQKLCSSYWFPLYAYARRRGHFPEDAKDLTQEFFARLLEGNWLARANQSRGRFRTFLLTAMEHFLANEWDKARALKRGGGVPALSLDMDTAEARFDHLAAEQRTPEEAFERRWAITLLEEVMRALEQEQEAEGKNEVFQKLKACLVGSSGDVSYGQVAEDTGTSEGAAKVAVHRLRQRYRELLRERIADTVESPEDVDAEMRHLFNVLSRSS